MARRIGPNMKISFKIWLENEFTSIHWIKPDTTEEKEDITRQARELDIDLKDLMQSIKQASLVDLDDKIWAKMKNTDSNDPKISLKTIKSWKNKDSSGILQAIRNGGTLPAPIVLMHKNIPISVAGNTRLSICKVLGIRPKVLMVGEKF